MFLECSGLISDRTFKLGLRHMFRVNEKHSRHFGEVENSKSYLHSSSKVKVPNKEMKPTFSERNKRMGIDHDLVNKVTSLHKHTKVLPRI